MSDGSGSDSFGPVPRTSGVKGWIIALAVFGMVGLGAGATFATRYIQGLAKERRDKRAAILAKLEESLRRSKELDAQRERVDELGQAETLANWIASRLREPQSPCRTELARAVQDVGSTIATWGDVRCDRTSFSWRSWKFTWLSGDETEPDVLGVIIGRRDGSPADDVLVVPTTHHSPSLFTRAAPTETLEELFGSLPTPDPSGRLPIGGRWIDAGVEFERLRTENHAAMMGVIQGVERVCKPEGAAGAGETPERAEPSSEDPEAEDRR